MTPPLLLSLSPFMFFAKMKRGKSFYDDCDNNFEIRMDRKSPGVPGNYYVYQKWRNIHTIYVLYELHRLPGFPFHYVLDFVSFPLYLVHLPFVR